MHGHHEKDWLHGVGLFNAQLPYTHDYDLWIRLLMNGASFGFMPDMLTMYRVHSQMGTVRHQATIVREYEMVKIITATYLSIWLSLAVNGDTMKILLATHWLIPHVGGVWNFMQQLKNRLEQLGHEVDLLGNSPDYKKSISSIEGRNWQRKLCCRCWSQN